MPQIVKLDDFVIMQAEFNEQNSVTSPPTGRTLRRFEVRATLHSQLMFNNYNTVIGRNRIRLEIPHDEIDLNVKVGNHTSSYSEPLGSSPINVRIELTEIDPDVPADHNIQAAVASEAVMNRLRIRTIISLLEDAGIFTPEQFDQRFQELGQKELETRELRNSILYGIFPSSDQDPKIES
ncbi:hypothetical protein SD70_02405 [Gordoniibacillus kamchatkensis]|uniref:Uncharacterized protein n=1 Tax=Gordoniibacillus kamchatkensis TaxID=1590651 RepID=A0ABR5ANV4_9BACL|nr:hypothetical protein [Paenibacillus sp. VKM B-2647]KIL42057.1 hypothetical protein SD70_02405 [Paenibacillus sp. VKM B-2647]